MTIKFGSFFLKFSFKILGAKYYKKILKIIQTSNQKNKPKLILSNKTKTLQKISYINKKSTFRNFFTNKLEIEKNKNQIISKVIKVFNKEK